jgi:hypothetical protein
MVRRIATDPKTGFTGVVLVASFAILRTPMAVFSAETALPWPSACWELSVMVETEGGHERAMRRGGCEEEPKP